jgi:hypothetical protein
VEVLRTEFANFGITSRVAGQAKVALFDGGADPLLSFFGSIDVLAARRDVRAFDFDRGQVVATVELPSHSPAGTAGALLSGITSDQIEVS